MWDKLPAYLTRTGEISLTNDKWLADSYRRCQEAGLARDNKTIRHSLFGEDLRDFLADYVNLIGYTHLLFSDIHQHLTDQRELFFLTDVNALVMEVHSHPEVLEYVVTQCGLKPGASLSEESCGTNAVALALRHRHEAIVRGEQHYCHLFSDWYSVATPVIGIDGRVAACIDISTSKDAMLGEKLALAKCLANELSAYFKGIAVYEYKINETINDLKHEGIKQNSDHVELTERQRQVLYLFAQGISYKQIARRLGITSIKTVEQHLDAVRSKLGATCRRECIQRAIENGLLHS